MRMTLTTFAILLAVVGTLIAVPSLLLCYQGDWTGGALGWAASAICNAWSANLMFWSKRRQEGVEPHDL